MGIAQLFLAVRPPVLGAAARPRTSTLASAPVERAATASSRPAVNVGSNSASGNREAREQRIGRLLPACGNAFEEARIGRLLPDERA